MKVPSNIFWILVVAAAPLFGQVAGSPQPPAAAPTSSGPPSSHAPSAAAGIEADIRDIRGPVPIPDPWLWVLYLAGGLAGAAAAYAAVRIWSKRAKTRIRLPHEIALERIERAGAFIDAGQSEEFSVEVSTAVRCYIEAIFQVHAPRKTTEEFLHDLLADSSSILARHSHLLEDFLKHCDLAKFARWSLSREEMEAMRESAKRFVIETQPKAEPAGAAKRPGAPNSQQAEAAS